MKVHPTIRDKPRVVIIGAGVIGLAIAWRLAAREVSVTLFDKGVAGSGASEALVTLGRASQMRWPHFAAELKGVSGIDVQLRDEGTLILAITADDRARLMHQLAFQQKLGLPVEWIDAAEAR